MASLNNRIDRLTRVADGTADDDVCARWMRQHEAQRARDWAACRARYFYASEVYHLRTWPGGPDRAEASAIGLLGRCARETGIDPTRWTSIDDVSRTAEGPHAAQVLERIHWCMGLLELQERLWPPDRADVAPDDRTGDDIVAAFSNLLAWLHTIAQHTEYTGE